MSQTFDVYSKNRLNEAVDSLVTLAENSNRAAPFTTLRTDINTVFNSVPAVLKTIDSINALQNQKTEAFAAFLPKVSVSAGSWNKGPAHSLRIQVMATHHQNRFLRPN